LCCFGGLFVGYLAFNGKYSIRIQDETIIQEELTGYYDHLVNMPISVQVNLSVNYVLIDT